MVTNGSRRGISNIRVDVAGQNGRPVGMASGDFIEAGFEQWFMVDAIDDAWGRVGVSPTIDVSVTLTFQDVGGHMDARPNGRVSRQPRRRGGERAAG
jgi:hypothetical protein